MLGMGPMEVAVILLVAFLFLGPQKMVQGAKTLGDLVSQMRKVTQTITDIDVNGQKIDNPVPYNRKKRNVKSDDSVDNHDLGQNKTDSED